jgi:acyl-homoserine lactone acylase PvdQ
MGTRYPLAAMMILAWTLVSAPASAQSPLNILPPGQNGLANLPQLGGFLATGARPAHFDDQLSLYRDLLHAQPGHELEFFKDASFGAAKAERTYSPRADVTIVRDGFGVPHITATTRAGAMFGTGYATAEDRLFFLDVFRHVGRAQLSSFAGGSPGNRAFDHLVWTVAPYTEADLQRQIDSPRPGFEAEAAKLRADLAEYVAGINAYIAETRLDPTKLPGEYAAIGRPQGPEDWKGTDTVATALVVGAILGVGGGGELASARVLEEAKKRFKAKGARVWRDFRFRDARTAPTTVRGRSFPYPPVPKKPRGRALPDPGSIVTRDVQTAGTGSGTQHVPPAPGAPPSKIAFPGAMSNAILVSARESQSGRPLAVFGPQTGYFAPQALMEQEVQAPGISARGVAFPGVNLYVQIGHGRNYAWSATTSAQDIVDTFAVDLCDDTHYRYHGQCLPIERMERTNAWQPNAADSTPEGSETLVTERTKLGLVVGRGTIKGRPVAYTRLRATYMHEPDSGLAFSYFNDPDRITGPKAFQKAASLIGYTFNWFYVDDRHIAYQNAGYNPRRARRTDPDLPIRGRAKYEWRGYDQDALSPKAFAKPSTHPQFVDQAWAADWNNKQARGYGAADDNWGYGPAYRSQLLSERVEPLVRGARKTTAQELTHAMIDAATVDLRADKVLPLALRLIGRPPDLAPTIDALQAWHADGSHRIDRDGDGRYEHAQAIAVFDAWWPKWMHAQFEPALGKPLFDAIANINELANLPNNHGDHLGSAWQDGWHGYALADLRRLLKHGDRRGWSRVYCGSRKRCRKALTDALRDAALHPEPYTGDPLCADGDQPCFDAIWFRPIGGVTQPLIPWQNRPTFQQVIGG